MIPDTQIEVRVQSALVEWRVLLGADRVVEGAQIQADYGADTGGAVRSIPAALIVGSAKQIPEIMRIALIYRIPVYPISTGNNWGYGSSLPPNDGCVILDLSGLNQILHFDRELGAVTVEPGVTLGMLADFLRQRGDDFMVPVTGAGPNCSLLGNALERGYGITPYADHFSAVTDIEAVLADGSLYRTALRRLAGADLARLFKWGVGPYSAGLFTQSGYGVVTSISLLLARRPECIKICLFSLPEDELLEESVVRIRRILSSFPGIIGGINLMNQRRVLAMAAPYPVDEVGPDGLIPEETVIAMGRKYQIEPWTGFMTLYGTEEVIKAVQRRVSAMLRGVGRRVLFLTPANAQRLLKAARLIPKRFGGGMARTAHTLSQSLELAAGRPNETALKLAFWRTGMPLPPGELNPAINGSGLIWYAPLVPMRATCVRGHVKDVIRITKSYGIEPLITLTSISDKLFDSTVPLLFDKQMHGAANSAKAAYDALLSNAASSGVFPYRFGVDTLRRMSEDALVAGSDGDDFHSKLKHAADPYGLISPGRYW